MDMSHHSAEAHWGLKLVTGHRSLVTFLCLLAGVAAAAEGEWAAATLAGVAAAAIYGAARRPELVLAVWVAVSPWASFTLRYPVERSIVTFDRVMLLSVVAGFLAPARA